MNLKAKLLIYFCFCFCIGCGNKSFFLGCQNDKSSDCSSQKDQTTRLSQARCYGQFDYRNKNYLLFIEHNIKDKMITCSVHIQSLFEKKISKKRIKNQ